MKVTVQEHSACFGIELTPETIAEAALLIRLGINATKDVRSVSATAHADGSIYGSVVIGKRKQSRCAVKAGSY